MTEKISTAEARSQFAEVINQVAYRGVRIVLTKHDKEVAAVIPIADLEKLALPQADWVVNAVNKIKYGQGSALDPLGPSRDSVLRTTAPDPVN